VIDDAATWCLVAAAAGLFPISPKKIPSSAVPVDEDREWNGIF
jgi:hypothetical protein